MRRFKDKTVIVTGAGSDIGRATAIRLANEGANVAVVGQSKDLIEETTKQFPQDNTWIHANNHLAITCDISKSNQVEAMIQHVFENFNSIDIVVNTIGLVAQQSMLEVSNEDVLSQMQTYQQQALQICYAAKPMLIKSKGNIINVLTCPNHLKPDVQTLHDSVNTQGYKITRKLAIEFAPEQIRVNSIDSSIVAIGNNNAQCILGRLPTAKDIAASIAFLASDDAAMITGIVLPVDAGMNALNTLN